MGVDHLYLDAGNVESGGKDRVIAQPEVVVISKELTQEVVGVLFVVRSPKLEVFDGGPVLQGDVPDLRALLREHRIDVGAPELQVGVQAKQVLGAADQVVGEAHIDVADAYSFYDVVFLALVIEVEAVFKGKSGLGIVIDL